MDFKEGHVGTFDSLIARIDSFTTQNNDISPKAIAWNCVWGGDWRGQWTKDFPSTLLTSLAERGIIGVINWIPDNVGHENICQRIADGEFDAYLAEWATTAKVWGGNVIVRTMWEMNGKWFFWSYPNNGNTYDNWKAAWRRMYVIVRGIAPNVSFFWCPNASDGMENYWVGDSYCQYTGIDTYKWAPPQTSAATQFMDISDTWIEKLRNLPADPLFPNLGTSKKNIIIGETAVSNLHEGTVRRQFLRHGTEGFLAEARKRGKLVCIIYFNLDANELGELRPGRDWRLDTEPDMLYAWKTLSSDPDSQGSFTI